MQGSCAHGSIDVSSGLKGMSPVVYDFGSCTSESSTHVLGASGESQEDVRVLAH